jgi:5-methylcytosine-specific restriction enzyme A
MPRVPKICGEPGCPDLCVEGFTRCESHGRGRRQAIASSTDRGYGREWLRVRAAFLRDHPRCVWCGGRAVTVDHIVPRPRGARIDKERWDHPSNLQAMCLRDHGRKTARHDGGYGNPKRPMVEGGLGGWPLS